jgi:hypothetical protein
MSIINPTQEISISNYGSNNFLSFPVTQGISPTGYWFYYTPVNGNNDTLGATLTPYQWDTKLPLKNSAQSLVMDGTMPLITESWDGANVKYHGSTIEWIGPGINDITGAGEDDAFFFSHLGALAASDDAFYWDRAFEPVAGIDWEYYQYHQHLPTFYAQYENGRQTMGGDGWIDQGDKAYAYLITSQVKVAGVTYSSVLARIHTPSVGGAHNSHNDVTLPSVGNKNYMPGGILRGIGERYHAFYITANDSQWTLYGRTYTDAAQSFTAEVNLGTYDFADPSFNPSSNQQSQYPVRASMGTSFGSKIYFPVIMNNATSGFDLEIWSFNSLDTISGGSLTRQVLASGVTTRPDAVCALYGTEALFVLRTDPANGGTRLHKYDGTTWTDQGAFLTNGTADPIRVHGFEFNTTDFKFYALLSGTATGGASTYLGPGLYSFQLDTPFAGYNHLDYDYTTNSFVERGPLEAGYLTWENTQASIIWTNSAEPQAIGAGTSVLNYTPPGGNNFFNKKQIGFGGKDLYYEAITLRDGRRFAAGTVEGNLGNYGELATNDLLFSVYNSDLSTATHFAFGGAGSDFFTGAWESQSSNKIWLTGYVKSELVPKNDIYIHGWCRNLSDGGNPIEWRDLAVDSSGNSYTVGAHDAGYIVVAKYDKDYDLIWQRILGTGTGADDVGYGIAVDSTGNVYVSGSTTVAGAGSTDALLVKINSSGTLQYAKVYGTASAENAKSIQIVNKSGTEYVVMAVVSGTSTTFLTTDLSGTIQQQFTYTNLVVNRIRTHQSESTSGRFLFAGNDGSTIAKFGMCQILPSTTFVQWVRTYSGAQTYNAYDIANTDAAVAGNGAGFAICGTKGTTDAFIMKVSVNESAGVYTITKSWAKTMVVGNGSAMMGTPGLLSMAVSSHTDTTRYIWAVGCTNISNISSMGMEEGLITQWAASDGTLSWQNVFGHDMEESFVAVANDTTGRNIISAGWSMSHSDSMDGVLFRSAKNGFGTGIYNLTTTGTAPYYYVASALVSSSNTDTLNTITTPTNTSGALVSASYSPDYGTSNYLSRNFDGAFGPAGLFTYIIAYIDLDLLAAYMNTDEFKATNSKCNALNYITDWSLIGKFWQAATVGDGSADDGNMFGYDIIETSTGAIFSVGQTSGDITKTNTGPSGVYDYLLVELDPITEEMEFYQNGTALDEETYALTELSDGRIAYTGRTSGDLGSPNEGGYDIFLGIFDPATELSDYYSVGSGLDDAGLNIHDLGNNELIIAYYTYGSLDGTTNSGSQDLGVIKFNYSTDTWGTAYQTGSTTSELYLQNGRPSALLSSQRVAVVASSQGVFADDAVTYGYLDVVLAILDLTTGIWTKYQIGTTANEIASSVSASGDILLISGNAGGSFTDDIDAIFVQFDATDGIKGITSSIG